MVLDTETAEDRWAVRLLNMMVCLHQLQVEGKTREMYIWGSFQVAMQFKLSFCLNG